MNICEKKFYVNEADLSLFLDKQTKSTTISAGTLPTSHM